MPVGTLGKFLIALASSLKLPESVSKASRICIPVGGSGRFLMALASSRSVPVSASSAEVMPNMALAFSRSAPVRVWRESLICILVNELGRFFIALASSRLAPVRPASASRTSFGVMAPPPSDAVISWTKIKSPSAYASDSATPKPIPDSLMALPLELALMLEPTEIASPASTSAKPDVTWAPVLLVETRTVEPVVPALGTNKPFEKLINRYGTKPAPAGPAKRWARKVHAGKTLVRTSPETMAFAMV